MHKEFYQLLTQYLKDAGMPLNGNSTARDSAQLFDASPGHQERALDVLFDTSRQIDATHGTDITTAPWENVVN